MFLMDPSRSWQTIVLLAVIVACIVWLVVQLEKRRIWRADQLAAQSEEPATDAPKRRHLTLVPQPAPQPLYDWQKQGI